MRSVEAFAHYEPKSGQGEPLVEHLKLVAAKAAEFATAFSAPLEAYAAGLLHDLGKQGDTFQKRLRGELTHVDHWSTGAWQALELYRENGVAIALVVAGHHTGIKSAAKGDLEKTLNPKNLRSSHPERLTPSFPSDDWIDWFVSRGLNLPERNAFASVYCWGTNNAGSMLDVRMLFSALVDADFLETEAWFNRDEYGTRRYRPAAPELRPEKALSALQEYIKELASKSAASQEMKKLRNRLFSMCVEAGKYKPGLFTLTAPTGSGKTLAMLGFALAHAMEHKLRRIVVVLPYLTLIEQTATAYRDVFQKFMGEYEIVRYICEDHSLSSSSADRQTRADTDACIERLLSENWDAPIIITTNVQFLESLFSNHPSACRKLHRLARSVILLDEVQTLPLSLVIPTLGTLSHLVAKYGTTVVFSTATQPAFNSLDTLVKKHSTLGWQPHEIVPDTSKLFNDIKRNKTILLHTEKAMSWDEIAERLAAEKQALCIVNTKRQARQLFQKVKTKRSDAFHLSTNMCPFHRIDTLARVRSLLDSGEPCCLISTQCVEAGVDIDFPVVFRSLGPLDAIAQAAGRCNRNARWQGHGSVYIFKPEEEVYPDDAYRQATDVAAIILNRQRVKELDMANLGLFDQYYRDLYSVRGIDRLEPDNDPLLEAIAIRDFVKVSHLYRVIPKYTISVLVPYDKNEYHSLAEEARRNGLSYLWIVRARPHSVSLFKPRSSEDQPYSHLESIHIKPGSAEKSTEWFICQKEEDYDLDTGLDISRYPDVIIA